MLRKIFKKLSNFRFTAMIIAGISTVAAIYALASLFIYHFAGDILPGETYLREVGFYGTEKGAYLGMMTCFCCFIVLFTSVYIVYSMFPFIKNSEKLLPRKGLLIGGFVSSVFELLLVILMIVLLANYEPNTATWIAVSLPFGIISTIGSILYLPVYILCDFYMPEIKRN